MIRLVSLVMALWLCGCATIVEGTGQTTLVESQPPGAQCDLTREGEPLAIVEKTPEQVVFEKSGKNVLVECARGALRGSNVLVPELSENVFGSWMIGGIIGMGIDAQSGAAYSYPESILIVLEESNR